MPRTIRKPEWDIFISYASEDRDSVATPLAEALCDQGIRVWYDLFELVPGKPLLQSIDEGLRSSKFGIVILSPNFFAKQWTMRELGGLHSRSIQEGDRPFIIPVWYKLNAGDLVKYSPILSNLVAVIWDSGLETVVKQILSTILPGKVDRAAESEARAFGEIYQALERPEYLAEAKAICSHLSTAISRSALAAIIAKKDLGAEKQGRALHVLIALDLIEEQALAKILKQANTGLLREAIALFTSQQELVLTESQVSSLLSNSRLPKSSTGPGNMIKQFIHRGAPYTSRVFLSGATHPSWAVKYDCVKTIIEISDRDSLQALAPFSTMSYWKARRRMVDYILKLIHENKIAPAEKPAATRILDTIIQDGNTDAGTSTMRLAREALESLGS
jgi:hypothetical protein